MGFFSKLINDAKNGNLQLDELKNAAQKVANEAAEKLKEAQNAVQNQVEQRTAAPANRPASAPASRPASAPVQRTRYPGAPGSWGPDMPAEENQFSYTGSFTQYFEMIFREEFPGYTFTCVPGKNPVYTLFAGGRKALVVELKSENSSAQKVRRACAAEGVPYIRFYYDHDGWWNTRSYVTTRLKAALNG